MPGNIAKTTHSMRRLMIACPPKRLPLASSEEKVFTPLRTTFTCASIYGTECTMPSISAKRPSQAPPSRHACTSSPKSPYPSRGSDYATKYASLSTNPRCRGIATSAAPPPTACALNHETPCA